jgi:formylglycine-generating enzyme
MKRTDLLRPTRPRGSVGAQRNSSPVATFDRILRAFDTGGFTYTDFLEQLNQLLATGAPAAELLEVLRRRELIEPLPRTAHTEVLAILNEALKREEVAAPPELHQTSSDQGPDELSEGGDPSPVNDGELIEILREAEEQIAEQQADYEALAQSFERAQAAESASVERANVLTAELAAAHAALESAHGKNRELSEFGAKSSASNDALEAELRAAAARVNALTAELAAAREEASRNLNRHQAELQALQEALTDRDAKVSELDALTADLAAAREEASRNLNRHQAELHEMQEALNARDERDADLASARTLLESTQQKNQELQQALAESIAATDVAITRGEDALNELNHQQAEVQKLREAVAAGDAAIAVVRRSLSERDSELGALKLLVEGGAQLQTDLRNARSRAESVAVDLKASQAFTAPLLAQRDRLQAQVASLQEKLKVYEDMVEQSHRAAEQRHAEHEEHEFTPSPLPQPSPQPQASPAAQPSPAARPSPAAQRASAAPTPAKPSVRAAGPHLRPGQIGRSIAIGAVILLVLGITWYVAHRTEAPPPVTPSVVVVAPAAGTVIRDCPSCPAMTVLPAGRFTQGSDRSDAPPFEKPLHWVIIGQPLAMSTNPVTVGEFQQFIEATHWDMQGCDTYDGDWKRHPENSWKSPGFEQTATHPVTCASWEDAQAFAEWLSTKTGHKYRLPSASEWEYAARAGAEAVQPWNSEGSDACANANVADASAAKQYPGWTVFACDDGYVHTAPVGSFNANAFGLHDMLGNVFQWTEDCWHPNYMDAPIDGSARDEGGCTERELRGGSWFSTPAYVRANYRNHFASDYRTSSVGIRLVRDVEQ